MSMSNNSESAGTTSFSFVVDPLSYAVVNCPFFLLIYLLPPNSITVTICYAYDIGGGVDLFVSILIRCQDFRSGQ